MKVSIVIPNYNGKKLLEKNLPDVIKKSPGAQFIVVDDASTDESVNFLKKTFPKVNIIRRIKNQGFSSTVNDGVKFAKYELVMLLNSDVVPENNYLAPLIKHFDDPKVFAVGSLQYSTGPDGKKIQGRGVGRFKKGFLIHGPGSADDINTLWVFGGAGLYRKSIWDKLGGMNTVYNPFYWEDIDISYRALKSGYKIYFEPASKVSHIHDTGSIISHYSQKEVTAISYRNQILFVWLNITDNVWLLDHALFLLFHILRSISSGNTGFISGFAMALKQIPRVIKQRKSNLKKFTRNDREILGNFRV